MYSDKIEYTAELHIKNSLLVRVMPHFISISLCVSMILTLLFTHIFADARRKLIEEVRCLDPTLDPRNRSLHGNGANMLAVVGIIQLLYISFWFLITGPLKYYKVATMYERVVGVVPRLISTFFLLDYFSAVAILIQQFFKNNKSLEVLRRKSLHATQYPRDERLFQQKIMDIADRHRKLCKITKRTNKIYTLQLLVNIALVYAFILAKTYIGIYTILSSVEPEMKIKIGFVNFVHVVVNIATLLLLVEITSRLCQEVRLNSGLYSVEHLRKTCRILIALLPYFQSFIVDHDN